MQVMVQGSGQHLAYEVQTGMCEALIKSRLSLMVKMIQEIISLPWADTGYPHNLMVNSWVFKDDESDQMCQNQEQIHSMSAVGFGI